LFPRSAYALTAVQDNAIAVRLFEVSDKTGATTATEGITKVRIPE